jgi:multiple antibiotic resistance protein
LETVIFFFKTFASIFAVMDPVGAVPLIVALTAKNTEKERLAMIRRGVVTAFFVLMFFGLAQLWLFSLFGFTLGAFRVAGGLFLMLIAFEMLTAKTAGERQSTEERQEGLQKEDISITPLAIPLLAGPATITNVVLTFGNSSGLANTLLATGAVALVCLSSWVVLRAAPAINRLLGATGVKVVTRMMGLILAAMAVQFVADGVAHMFPILRRA